MFVFLLSALVLIIFRNAFLVNFFSDDYFFLKISRAANFSQFLGFFSPVREHSYKPVGTELYYFIIHCLNDNRYLGHAIAFIIFFTGLWFLYKTILKISSDSTLSKIFVFMYAIHFTHVFQLYYFATFQEVAMFTFLSSSLYFFLEGKTAISLVMFISALLSKETAILYAVFLPAFLFFFRKNTIGKKIGSLSVFLVTAIIFAFIYRYSLTYVTRLDNYKIVLSPSIYINNTMWYFLWSLGLPNYMPDYMISIFGPLVDKFWEIFSNFPETGFYFAFIIIYLVVFLGGLTVLLIRKKVHFRKIFAAAFLSIAGFFIFIGPIGFFMHKWMVRLTVPLIFVVGFQAYVLNLLYKRKGLFRNISLAALAAYFIFNIVGIRVHESSSTFFLESSISGRLKKTVKENKETIKKKKTVYFKDSSIANFNPWGQSKHLKTTLSDQNFLDFYFPGEKIKASYGFENRKQPGNSFVIESLDLIRQ